MKTETIIKSFGLKLACTNIPNSTTISVAQCLQDDSWDAVDIYATPDHRLYLTINRFRGVFKLYLNRKENPENYCTSKGDVWLSMDEDHNLMVGDELTIGVPSLDFVPGPPLVTAQLGA